MDRELKLAYMAGIVDGEAYIGIKKRLPSDRNKMLSPKYSPCISLSMTDQAPLLLFCDLFSVRTPLRRRRKTTHKEVCQIPPPEGWGLAPNPVPVPKSRAGG